MDRFSSGYVGAALDYSNLKGEISRECLTQMKADCAAFQRANQDVIDAAVTPDMNVRGRALRHCESNKQERAGKDFWLTRNRSGAGFWDGDWSEPQATILTNAAHQFGEFDLLQGDDGEIDCYPPPNSRSNPMRRRKSSRSYSSGGLSTGQKVAIGAAVVAVLFVVGSLVMASTASASEGPTGASGPTGATGATGGGVGLTGAAGMGRVPGPQGSTSQLN